MSELSVGVSVLSCETMSYMSADGPLRKRSTQAPGEA